MNFNEVFKIRAVKKNEEDIYMITIGDKLASKEADEYEKKLKRTAKKTKNTNEYKKED